MSVEANVCPNCGFALKESDEYCSQCGYVKNSAKLNSILKFKFILLLTLIIGFIYPLGLFYLQEQVVSRLITNRLSNPFELQYINSFLAISQIVFYLILLFLVFVFCKIAYYPLNKINIKKFILFDFILAGLGYAIGELLSRLYGGYFALAYYTPLNDSIDVIAILFYFLSGGLIITSMVLFSLLFQNLTFETNKYAHYPKLLVLLFAFGLGFLSTFAINSFNYLSLNYLTANYLNGGSTSSLLGDLIGLVSSLSSFIALILEFLLILIFVKIFTVILAKKSIIIESFLNYIAITIGSFLGYILSFIFVAFVINSFGILSIYISNLYQIVYFIFSSMNVALPVCILLISVMLVYRKVSVPNTILT